MPERPRPEIDQVRDALRRHAEAHADEPPEDEAPREQEGDARDEPPSDD